MTEIRVHQFQADQSIEDWRGRRPCVVCGFPERSRFHDVPDLDPEAAVIDARILGESNE